MVHASIEQARLLADLFIGRQSDYALQTSTGRYRRVGLPISLETVQAHLDGLCTLGTYVLDECSQCFFAVFDADQVDGLMVLTEIRRRLASDGIPSYLEVSRRGGHLWVLFSAAAPALAVRQWLLPYCPASIEFYPKQDQTEGVGSLIRVPLGVHQLSGERYAFVIWRNGDLVPVASSLAGMLSALSEVGRVAVPPLPVVATHPAAHTHTSQTPIPSPIHFSSRSAYPPGIEDWCAGVEPFSFIGRYLSLDRRGMGCCPFGEHHRGGRDRHPSFQVFQPKRPGGTCWRCYTGEISGNVFNFLQLYHKLDASELWTRLYRGEVL